MAYRRSNGLRLNNSNSDLTERGTTRCNYFPM